MYIQRWMRTAGRRLAGLLTVLVGGGMVTACYGMPIPSSDPAVHLVDFSYAPTAARPGDLLTFNAVLNKPAPQGACDVTGLIGDETAPVAGVLDGRLRCYLNDYGYPPDVTAGDGVWTGDSILPADLEPQSGLPVTLSLEWYDGQIGSRLSGTPLTVLPLSAED